MNRAEEAIHKSVWSHFNQRKVPGVFGWHTPNQGKRGWAYARATQAMGMVAGVPDLTFLMRGQLYALELKTAEGRETTSQRLTMQRMRDCGAHVAVARSLDEALVTLECWGLIKRDCSVVSSPNTSPDEAGQGNERPQRTTESAS